MKNKFLIRLFAVSTGLMLLAPGARAATISLSGFLTGTNNWTADNTYVLTNFTYVLSNAVLNIEPGTWIQGVKGSGGTNVGSGANDFGCLFICRGGKIFAEGSPSAPIVFTSTSDDGFLPFPTRGEWGGIVMFGHATLNNPAFTTNAVNYDIYEGLTDDTNPTTGEYLHRFGGTDDDDSSGVLRYVSIRHGGKLLSTDKEVNGLSLGGVGRGTVIDHVEAFCIADDGFEFFGGSVNTKYLVSAFNDDDTFDTDEGYHGKNQFWFAIQEPGKRDEGSEQNGQPNSPDISVPGALPLANYEIYNATLIGAGTNGSGNDSLNIRVRNFCKWYNSVFTEFQGKRADIDGTSQPDIRNNIFWQHPGGNGTGYGTVYCPADANPIVNPLLHNTDRGQNLLLDPRPAAGSPVFSGYTNAPNDGFYSDAPYKGAFDSQNNWLIDWTALYAEGHLPLRTTKEVKLSGFLAGTNNWYYTNIYVLTNFTYVLSNAVLNIEGGTLVRGVKGSGGTNVGSGVNDFGCLFVCRGGKLMAAGGPSTPIIFTSTSDDGFLPFPTRGEWGGIVMFGHATLNNPAFTTNAVNYDIYEGLTDDINPTTGEYLHRFGGTDDDDSSGVLRYVSIRHGGKLLSTDKEVNGLSLGGVGRGTVIDHVEAFCIADDGFEFFGGSVNTKYLVSAFNDDDTFDTDEGYHGKNQFWFAIQEPGKRDEGSEQNGQPNAPDVSVPGALPLSNYEIYNATLIGAGTNGSGNDSLNIRIRNFCKWYNSVFTEFQGKRADIDGTSQPDIRNNIFWQHPGGNGTGYGTVYCPADANPIVNPLLRSTDRGQNLLLDPRPAAGSPAFSGYTNAPGNGFYSVANYKGAFNGVNWAYDWTGLTAEAHFALHGGGLESLPLATSVGLPVQPTLTIVDLGNGNVQVSWPTETGFSYQLQSKSPITGGWGNAGSLIPGTGGTYTSPPQAITGDEQYFQVKVQ